MKNRGIRKGMKEAYWTIGEEGFSGPEVDANHLFRCRFCG